MSANPQPLSSTASQGWVWDPLSVFEPPFQGKSSCVKFCNKTVIKIVVIKFVNHFYMTFKVNVTLHWNSELTMCCGSHPHLVHLPNTDVIVMPVRMVNYSPASPPYCLPGWFVKFSYCCAFSHPDVPGRRDSWFKAPRSTCSGHCSWPLSGHARVVLSGLDSLDLKVLPPTLTLSAVVTISSARSTGRYWYCYGLNYIPAPTFHMFNLNIQYLSYQPYLEIGPLQMSLVEMSVS